jgi:hypothetical protein
MAQTPWQSISPVLTDAGSVDELNPDGGGVLNQLPSLKEVGDTVRLQNIVFNFYKDSTGNRYGTTHPNAQSDGDNYGRGDVANQVGTKVDSTTKDTLLYSSGNKYAPGTGYYNNNYGEQYW